MSKIDEFTELAANITANTIKAPFKFIDKVLTKLFFED